MFPYICEFFFLSEDWPGKTQCFLKKFYEFQMCKNYELNILANFIMHI